MTIVTTNSNEQAAAFAWAMEQRTERSADHHILCVLAWAVAPGTFIAAPGVAALAEVTGLERKTVMHSLARLVTRGLIEVLTKAGKTRRVNAYRLAVVDGAKGI